MTHSDHLPRLTLSESLVLAKELDTAAADLAEKHPLPDAVTRSRTRFLAAAKALSALVTLAQPEADMTKREADLAVDNAWSATFDWLSGWTKLPDAKIPSASAAHTLFALCFPDVLSFTRLPYKVEWHESQKRLEAIAKQHHAATFTALGGAAFLETIQEAHATYGAILGITAPLAPPPPSDASEPFYALLAALRDYVSRCANVADPDVASSQTLSSALLAPVHTWTTRHPHPKKQTTTPTPSAPSAGTTTGA